MKSNVTFSIGSIALVEKINVRYHLFDSLFEKIGGKARHLKETAKLLVVNRLDKCASIRQLPAMYPTEFFQELGFPKTPRERNTYRNLERLGENFAPLLERYQQLAKRNGLASATQFLDWTSAYFEGTKSELGALGYSRDGQPGKKQITIGVSTGINGIPSAMTVQKGNVNDKKHFAVTLKTVSKILEPDALLVFDCGANTRENKRKIRKLGFHYLTLRQKQRGPYRHYLRLFDAGEKQAVESNGVRYECVKVPEEACTSFVFFSRKLQEEQLHKREKKFVRELKRNDGLLRKVFRKKDLQRFVTRKGYVVTNGRLQKALKTVPNPFVTGLEGYFILESSVDAEPEAVLRLYKNRDKAEKLIRDLKEGTELRPIRHWSKSAVLGCLLVVFLTNCVTSLTRFLAPNSLVVNVKLLKKFLQSLTVTVVYPRNGFRLRLLSNVSLEIESVLGVFVCNFGQKTFDLPS